MSKDQAHDESATVGVTSQRRIQGVRGANTDLSPEPRHGGGLLATGRGVRWCFPRSSAIRAHCDIVPM